MHKDVKCPSCGEAMGLYLDPTQDMEDMEIGNIIECGECADEFEVINVDPLKLKAIVFGMDADDVEDEDEDDDEF